MIGKSYKIGAFLFAFFPVYALAGNRHHDEHEERTVSESAPMSANGTLDVSNVAGEVTIIGWDRAEVEVKGEIGSGQELEFSADGEHTRVEVRWSEDHDDEDAEIVIRAPATSRVRASSVSASITVSGFTNELQLQSVSGDIDTEVYGADVTLGTISGSLQVAGHKQAGEMRLTVVSGDAWVRDIEGDLVARTVSGDLNIRAGKLRRTRIDTTSGDVLLSASLEPDARFEIDSTSGDLRLELCGKPEAEYELSSFSGEIVAFDRYGEARNEYGPTSELRFKVGKGGALVRIDSLSGEISLDDC
jgi:DUF4097 and DUF4098 domain-containing protein YvlB